MRKRKTPNPEYNRAFRDYIRYGISITVPYYLDNIETKSAKKYIWDD